MVTAKPQFWNPQPWLVTTTLLARAYTHERLCQGFFNKFRKGFGRSFFRFVLDGGSIRLDDINGGKGVGIQIFHDKFTLVIPTETVDIHAVTHLFGKFFHGLFHGLTVLTPGRVDRDNRGLVATGQEGRGVVFGGQLLDGTGSFFPQIPIPGTFGTIDVDAAFRLGGTILFGQSNKATNTFLAVIEPNGLVTRPFTVLVRDGTILRNRNGILAVSMGVSKKEKNRSTATTTTTTTTTKDGTADTV